MDEKEIQRLKLYVDFYKELSKRQNELICKLLELENRTNQKRGIQDNLPNECNTLFRISNHKEDIGGKFINDPNELLEKLIREVRLNPLVISVKRRDNSQ